MKIKHIITAVFFFIFASCANNAGDSLYRIIIGTSDNGALLVTPSGQKAEKGDTIILTLIVTDDNYESVTISTVPPLEINTLGNKRYSFIMPGEKVTVNFSVLYPEIDGLKLGDIVQGKGRLAWRDEFNGTSLDTAKWNYDYGNGTQYNSLAPGWGNAEKQWYMPSNAKVENGLLVIEARKDAGGNYSSAKITTKGTLSSDGYTTYPQKKFLGVSTGAVEARIKGPRGTGFWPAFWMLGANVDRYSGYENIGWPRSGEIDIYEMNGSNMSSHGQVIHYFNPSTGSNSRTGTGNYVVPNMADDFHVYGVEWNKTGVRFYFDGEYKEHPTNGPITFPLENCFSEPFYDNVPWVIIINLAVGGNYLQGAVPDDAVFEDNPQAKEDRSLKVDWVRVYEEVK